MTNPDTVLDFDLIEDCFPDGASCTDHGQVICTPQWLHDFARAIEQAILAKLAEKAEPIHQAQLINNYWLDINEMERVHFSGLRVPVRTLYANQPTDTALLDKEHAEMYRALRSGSYASLPRMTDPFDDAIAFTPEGLDAAVRAAIKAHKGKS